MTAAALDIHEWILTFHATVEAQLAEIHPSAQCICLEWIGEMHAAANAGDMDEVARLVEITQDKIADERTWEEDKLRSAADPHYLPRCMRRG
jgi:hypothetical protein